MPTPCPLPGFLPLGGREIHVWHCQVAPPVDADWNCLSPREQERAGRFHFERDRWRFIQAHSLVRQVLSRYAGLAPQDWQFTLNPWGKPFIAPGQNPDPLFFNLSHAGGQVVCAVARFAALGVDVEDRIPTEFLTLARQFFTPEEVAWLVNDAVQATPDQPMGLASTPTLPGVGVSPVEIGLRIQAPEQRFLALWTLKEAYVKALGTGLSTALDTFSFGMDALGAPRLTQAQAGVMPNTGWHFRHQPWGSGAWLALAAKPAGDPTWAPDIRFYPWEGEAGIGLSGPAGDQ